VSVPRHIAQPGPAPAQRIVAVEGRGLPMLLPLRAGARLVDAIHDGFAARSFAGGVVTLDGVALGPFGYVMPALSETGENAAFYSAVFRPQGACRISGGALTQGRRDGAPFFHAHAVWHEADGVLHGGHLLPAETVVAEDVTVPAIGLDGAVFTACADGETNFTLFEPVPAPRTAPVTDRQAFALRLRPNQDLAGAIEAFCAARGLAAAAIHGGVGSTIGARMEDGAVVEPFATEVYLAGGRVMPGPDGAPAATLPAGLVDYTGGIATGRLRRGDNPVLMTFELVIAADPSA